MKPDRELELVELMLKKLSPQFTTDRQKVCWERGFLTGLLARLAADDSLIKSRLAQIAVKK